MLRALLFCALALCPVSTWAQITSSPRNLGMVGATRGDPIGTGSVIANPAGMARAYQYAAQTFYQRGPDSTNAVGVNIVDSKTQPALAVGVSYGYEWTDDGADLDIEGHNARLAFAHSLVKNRVHVGASLHYLRLTRGDDDVEDLEGFTLDAGLHASLSPNFHLGISGENLIKMDDPAMPRRAGGGIAFTGESFTLDADLMMDFDTQDSVKPIFAGGLELLLAETVPLRAGYRRDQATENSYVGGGIGFVNGGQGGASSSQLHLSYEQNIEDSAIFQFSVGLTMFM